MSGAKPIMGGDISRAFKLFGQKKDYFIKLNSEDIASDMFHAEYLGLDYLAKHSSFVVPTPLLEFKLSSGAIGITMEFIVSCNKLDFEAFGKSLADLHLKSCEFFGFGFDNFIGKLNQSNSLCDNFLKHYVEHRIDPLVHMAFDTSLISSNDVSTFEKFYTSVNELIPAESPALIHGDLWNGNFFFNHEGMPVIFDPAPAYSHREFDIAMMQLFGGFHPTTFDAYHAHCPLENDWQSRTKYFQLYHLLVHLCLFGKSYYNQVIQIVNKFR